MWNMLPQFHLNATGNRFKLRNDRWQPILQITLGRHIQFGLLQERSFTTACPNYVKASYKIIGIMWNMLSQFHLNTTYNYNYINRSLTTNSPNYVRAAYTIWVTLRIDRWQQIFQITLWRHIQCVLHYERSLTTDFPNYVRATYTKLVALCEICCPSFTFMRHAIELNQEMIVDNLFSKLH